MNFIKKLFDPASSNGSGRGGNPRGGPNPSYPAEQSTIPTATMEAQNWSRTPSGAKVFEVWKQHMDSSATTSSNITTTSDASEGNRAASGLCNLELSFVEHCYGAPVDEIALTPLAFLQLLLERLSKLESEHTSGSSSKPAGRVGSSISNNNSSSTTVSVNPTLSGESMFGVLQWLPGLKSLEIASRSVYCRRGMVHHGLLGVLSRINVYLTKAIRGHVLAEDSMPSSSPSPDFPFKMDEGFYDVLERLAPNTMCWTNKSFRTIPHRILFRMILFAAVESIGDILRRLIDFNGNNNQQVPQSTPLVPLRQPMALHEVLSTMTVADTFCILCNLITSLSDSITAMQRTGGGEYVDVTCSPLYFLDVLRFWATHERDLSMIRRSSIRSMAVSMLGFPKDYVMSDVSTSASSMSLSRYTHRLQLQVAVLELVSALVEQHPNQIVELHSFGFGNVLKDSMLWVAVGYAAEIASTPLSPKLRASGTPETEPLQLSFSAIAQYQQQSHVANPRAPNFGEATAQRAPAWARTSVFFDALRKLIMVAVPRGRRYSVAGRINTQQQQQREEFNSILDVFECIVLDVFEVSKDTEPMGHLLGSPSAQAKRKNEIARTILRTIGPLHHFLLEWLCIRLYVSGDVGPPTRKDPAISRFVETITKRTVVETLLSQQIYLLGLDDSIVRQGVIAILCSLGCDYHTERNDSEIAPVIGMVESYASNAVVVRDMCSVLLYCLRHSHERTITALRRQRGVTALCTLIVALEAQQNKVVHRTSLGVGGNSSVMLHEMARDSVLQVIRMLTESALVQTDILFDSTLQIVGSLFQLLRNCRQVREDIKGILMSLLLHECTDREVYMLRLGPFTSVLCESIVSLARVSEEPSTDSKKDSDCEKLIVDELNLIQQAVSTKILQDLANTSGRTSFRRELQMLFVEGNAFVYFVSLFSRTWSPTADRHALCITLLRTLASLMFDNDETKQKFFADVIRDEFVRSIVLMLEDQPTEEVVDQLMCMVGEVETVAHVHHLRNYNLVPSALALVQHPVLRCSNEQQAVNVFMDRLVRLLTTSTHNTAKACSVDLFDLLIPMLVDNTNSEEIRRKIASALCTLGAHHITVRQVKRLLTVTAQSTDKRNLLRHIIFVLCHSVQNSSETAGTVFPRSFFLLGGRHAGIEIAKKSSNTYFSNGYSIEYFINIDTPGGGGAEATASRLLKFVTDDDTEGSPSSYLELRFRQNYIEVRLDNCDGEGVIQKTVNYKFETRRWYRIVLSHSEGRLLIAKPELKLYVDGDLSQSLHVPFPRHGSKLVTKLFICDSFCGQLAQFRLFSEVLAPTQLGDFIAMQHTLINIRPHQMDGHTLVDLGATSTRHILTEVPVYGKMLPGTSVCVTNTIVDAVECIGGLHHVLIPLLATIHCTDVSFTADKHQRKPNPKPIADVARHFIMLIHLLCDMVRHSRELIDEMEERHIIPVMWTFMRDLAPEMDPDVVQGIRHLLIVLQRAVIDRKSPITSSSPYVEAIRFLCLDMTLWAPSSYEVQKEVLNLILDLFRDTETFPDGPAVLLQLNAVSVLLETPRLVYQKSGPELHRLRMQVYDLVHTLLPQPLSYDAVSVIFSELKVSTTLLGEPEYVHDTLRFLYEIQRAETRSSATSTLLFSACHRLGVVSLMHSVVQRCEDVDVRNLAIAIVGNQILSCAETRELLSGLPHGLTMFSDALCQHTDLDSATYHTLRSIMLGKCQYLKSTKMEKCKPIQGSSEALVVPSVFAVVLKLAPSATYDLQQVILQDCITLVLSSPANCDIMLQHDSWHSHITTLSIPMGGAVTNNSDLLESDHGGGRPTSLTDSVHQQQQLAQYMVGEMVLDLLKVLCFHALKTVDKGWTHVQSVITMFVHYNHPQDTIHTFLDKIVDSYMKDIRDCTFLLSSISSNNLAHFVLLCEEELLYGSWVRANEGDYDEAKALVWEPRDDDEDERPHTWAHWHTADKILRILFHFKMHAKDELDASSSNAYFTSRRGGLNRVCTRFLRLCLSTPSPREVASGRSNSFGTISLSGTTRHTALENHLRFVEDLILHSRMKDDERERSEDMFTLGRLPTQQNEMNSLTFTYQIIAILLLALQRYTNASKKSSNIQKIIQRIQWVITLRKQLLLRDPTCTDLVVRNFERKDFDISAFRHVESLPEWSRLASTFTAALEGQANEDTKHALLVLKHRNDLRTDIHHSTTRLAGARMDYMMRLLRSLPQPPSHNADTQDATSWLHDSNIVAARAWRRICKNVWLERSPWVDRAQDVTLVRLSRVQQRLGVHLKLKLDPDGTRHETVTNSGPPKEAFQPKGKPILPTRARAMSGNNPQGEPPSEKTPSTATGETINSATRPDEFLEQAAWDAATVPEAPATSAVIASVPCEVAHLLQVWSGTMKATREFLSIVFDEKNTAYNQRVAADAASFLHPPSDMHWNVRTIVDVFPARRFRMARTAMELVFSDNTGILINFPKNESDGKTMYKAITSVLPKSYAKLPHPLTNEKLDKITERWRKREISNFDYLMELNFRAGRTLRDITQYPIFPWVLRDYTSSTIDLNDPKVYRDFTMPAGANGGPAKVDELQRSYNELVANGDDPHHYFSYCSNAAVVLYYMIRVEPFTTMHIIFEGGKFNLTERLFHSISNTWNGVITNSQDNKELIPEMYYLPEIAINNNQVKFSASPNCTFEMSELNLPPWAKKNPHTFTRTLREALESEYCSSQLHHWIDLMFGKKQRGRESVPFVNTYFADCYYEDSSRNGNVPFFQLDEQSQRRVWDAADNLGQVPTQLFKKSHPQRNPLKEVIYHPLRDINTLSCAFVTKRNPSVDLTGTSVGCISLTKDRAVICGLDGRMQLHRLTFASSNPYTMNAVTKAAALAPPPSSESPDSPASSNGGRSRNNSIMSSRNRSGSGSGSRFPLVGPRDNSLPFGFDVSEATNKSFPLLSRYGAQRGGGGESFSALAVAVTSDQVVLFSASPREDCCYATSMEWPRPEKLVGHSDLVTAITISPDNVYLVTGSRDTTCVLWKLYFETTSVATPLRRLYGHEDGVTALAVSTESDVIASGARDGTILLHSLSGGKYERTLRHPSSPCSIDAIAIASNPISVVLVAGGVREPMVCSFSINGGTTPLNVITLASRPTCMALSPDQKYLWIGCTQRKGGGSSSPNTSALLACEVSSLNIVHNVKGIGTVRSLGAHPTNPQVLIAGHEDGTCTLVGVAVYV